MKILIALLVFSVIIIIHELGHFLFAKLNGITVVEFSLGMGTRLLSHEWGGTRYSLKLLPFGGSCMMLGEDEDEDGEGTFGSKSVWARISVIVAGPVFNFLLAFVLSLFIIGNIGYDVPILLGVSEGMPAQEAGLQAGDRITKMNGRSIRLYREVQNYSMFHEGEPVVFEYERDGQTYTTTVEPVMTQQGYKYGISGSVNYRHKTNVMETVKYSAYEVYYWIDLTIQSLKMLLHGGVNLNDVSGPVGVVDVIGDTYEESKSDGLLYIWLNLMNVAILLTANLGVMNLLPIPALDGGRLVFLLLEAIRRKRVNPETEAKIHFAGLMLLLVSMVVVMFNDVRKIFF
ncbi:MAG: RIP metalloprotease RseP [Lachnospiraceae bacterium]|nr:RIP metalloprotease RseP [Lachnospiraceae bacterium]RKJ48891.1 RIP metalloprotease RseP [bacterium 1XD42-54]